MPPNLLPNLHSIEAEPATVGQLIPGRPIRNVYINGFWITSTPSISDTIFQALRLSYVPVTSLKIVTHDCLLSNSVFDMIQTLPKLREFILDALYEVCWLLKGRTSLELTSNSSLSPPKAYYLPLGDAKRCVTSN